MKLIPLTDRIVLKEVETEEKTDGGIFLTSKAQERPQFAEIVAVGPGTDDIKMVVEVGQKVVYTRYTGTEVKDGDEAYIIVRQADIQAIVED
ncbi:MAG: co-chaperone GroES [Lachnospiraceae bacterium]|nr:co-chaperone GroES [Lachnospiraceae bacterium]